MFFHHKRVGNSIYVYLVESVYEDGRTRQHINRNLGRRTGFIPVFSGGLRSTGPIKSDAPKSPTFQSSVASCIW